VVSKILALFFRYSRFLLLVIIFAVLAFLDRNFLTAKNLSNVITQQAPFLMIISFGMTLSIITKGIELSMGSVLALSSCLAAAIIKAGHLPLGIAVALLVGFAIGTCNGLLITKVGLSPFIATYTVDWVTRGAAYTFMGGMLIYDFEPAFRWIGTGHVFGISNLVIFAVVIFAVLAVVTKRTVLGRNIYSIGFNPAATRLTGINTDRIIILVYAVNGLMAAVTGLLYISRLNAAESIIGQDFNLKAIAATLIGGTTFGGGRGSVFHTVVGTVIMVLITNGINLMGISSLWQDAFLGCIIFFAVVLDKIGQKFSV